MDMLEAMWNYQLAELAFEDFEDSLKNTETRKKMAQYQKLFSVKQLGLKNLEKDAAVQEHALKELSTQISAIVDQMDQKKQELAEMADYDLDDLFIEDVRESIKESEATKNTLEQCKRKIVEIKKKLEADNEEIVKTLRTMSAAIIEYDRLKEVYNQELGANAGEIDKLKQAIVEAAKQVDPDMMAKYKKIKARYKNPIARLNNDRCSGCNMQLPVSVLGKLKAKDSVVECDSCGRIIYV